MLFVYKKIRIRKDTVMYEFDSRVRYSETDAQGRMTWLALMDYFQDCSVFHSGVP